MGCGVEKTFGKRDTPGFPNQRRPEIMRDARGFKKLILPRHRQRRRDNVIQSSFWQVLSWRANCDVQPILYQSDPEFPDMSKIGRVTDYIVAYACKGVETFLQQRETVRSLILTSDELYCSKKDVARVAKQVLNKMIGDKLVSKQEVLCLALSLPLHECSDQVEILSISGMMKLGSR